MATNMDTMYGAAERKFHHPHCEKSPGHTDPCGAWNPTKRAWFDIRPLTYRLTSWDTPNPSSMIPYERELAKRRSEHIQKALDVHAKRDPTCPVRDDGGPFIRAQRIWKEKEPLDWHTVYKC